jgi:hypothetical protein
MEMYCTATDLTALYALLPELLAAAKARDCKLIIGDAPFIWEPETPKAATIYSGVGL